MNTQSLITTVQRRLQEGGLEGTTILGWFDDAQRRFGIKCGAKFPSFLNPDGTQSTVTEPAFDEKYSELLIVFACARYRESDEAISEAEYLDNKFISLLDEFATNIYVEPIYRDDPYSQQFISGSNQIDFIITKPNYEVAYNDLHVYVNNVLMTERLDYLVNGNKVSFLAVQSEGSKITCVWQPSELLNDRPILWGDW